MRACAPLVIALLAAGARMDAGEASAPPAPAATAPAAGQRQPAGRPAARAMSIREMIQAEEAWRFNPPVDRPDMLYDLEAILAARRANLREQENANAKRQAEGQSAPTQAEEIPVAWSIAQKERVDLLLAERKWPDAMRTAENALKALERHRTHPDIAPIAAQIEQARGQAEEALTREEAQAEFNARGLRIDGILWSESGQRLAIIADEPKAVGVNDRVKDCVVINIDTDRVDFRFHYKRRRFEFPIYVGEGSSARAATR